MKILAIMLYKVSNFTSQEPITLYVGEGRLKTTKYRFRKVKFLDEFGSSQVKVELSDEEFDFVAFTIEGALDAFKVFVLERLNYDEVHISDINVVSDNVYTISVFLRQYKIHTAAEYVIEELEVH